MRHILVLHRSKHGHTERIAERVAERIRDDGHEATVQSLEVADILALDTYDGIVVGSSVHAGHHEHGTIDWLYRHRSLLNRMPSAAFSVSLSAAEDTDEAREHTRSYLRDLLDDSGWTPALTASFAGAIQYREYDFFTRTLIRMMMKRAGHPTDTSHDHVYTDWDAVDAFADQVAALVADAAAATA